MSDSEQQDFVKLLRKDIGATGEAQVARHEVNEPMIAHWCDAMGDDNPCYTDAEFAAKSVHGGIVAPPAMLDVWDRGGLKAKRSENPRDQVIQDLEARGFISVVAVASELDIVRYVRPGELLKNVMILEDVSEEKQTGLGVGHFITTRHRFTNQHDEHVGDLMFRILKFKGGTGRQKEESGRPAPNPDPSLRPRPAINRDNEFFWDGARQRELRIQKCTQCDLLLAPPSPRCPQCGSFERSWIVSKGLGTLYSFAVPHFPAVNGFRYPVQVGLIELDEGTRVVANVIGVNRADLKIGLRVGVDFIDTHPALVEGEKDSRGPITLPVFRALGAPRNETTRTATTEGEPLVPWTVPVTPTLIVSGAIATRDYQDVHHDRDLAHAKGSADIFLNINTSIALMGRFVTDWAGPEAIVKALRVKLGAPAYPYDPLAFTGSVKSFDPASGETVVQVAATNSLGPHVSGTVELVLPQAGK